MFTTIRLYKRHIQYSQLQEKHQIPWVKFQCAIAMETNNSFVKKKKYRPWTVHLWCWLFTPNRYKPGIGHLSRIVLKCSCFPFCIFIDLCWQYQKELPTDTFNSNWNQHWKCSYSKGNQQSSSNGCSLNSKFHTQSIRYDSKSVGKQTAHLSLMWSRTLTLNGTGCVEWLSSDVTDITLCRIIFIQLINV